MLFTLSESADWIADYIGDWFFDLVGISISLSRVTQCNIY